MQVNFSYSHTTGSSRKPSELFLEPDWCKGEVQAGGIIPLSLALLAERAGQCVAAGAIEAMRKFTGSLKSLSSSIDYTYTRRAETAGLAFWEKDMLGPPADFIARVSPLEVHIDERTEEDEASGRVGRVCGA